MPERDDDVYDGFRVMVGNNARFLEQYHSFTTDKTYTDLLGRTASGLLRDAAAKTAELPSDLKKKHKDAQEVFAAFCMYFCLEKIRRSFKETDPSLAGDTVTPVYLKILKRIRRDLEEKGECSYVRNLVRISADHAMLDILRTEKRYVSLADLAGDTAEDEYEKLPPDILADLIDGTNKAIRESERAAAMQRAIAAAAKKKILTRNELLVVCHSFGYGNGFKKLKNLEIAKKLGRSDGTVSKIRKTALRKLRDFLENDPEACEILF